MEEKVEARQPSPARPAPGGTEGLFNADQDYSTDLLLNFINAEFVIAGTAGAG